MLQIYFSTQGVEANKTERKTYRRVSETSKYSFYVILFVSSIVNSEQAKDNSVTRSVLAIYKVQYPFCTYNIYCLCI